MAVQWCSIPDYEGYYEASDRGWVRSLDRVVTRRDGSIQTFRGRMLIQHFSGSGYFFVTLSKPGCKPKPASVHRLVAEAFLPRPDGATEVRHLNDIKIDNRLVNLAWGTRSDNMYDSVRNNVHPESKRTHCSKGHEFIPENTLVRSDGGRRCRSCVCAKASVAAGNTPKDKFQTYADHKFKEITNDSTHQMESSDG